ncbi:MAG: hypothetical protein HYR94_16860 [Chloroflexi bacterium]|nr:hypothetical protein [Chloroflexota bacterium]
MRKFETSWSQFYFELHYAAQRLRELMRAAAASSEKLAACDAETKTKNADAARKESKDDRA